MFPNFAYARCATGFEPRSGREIFLFSIPVQTSLGAVTSLTGIPREKYKHDFLRELIIKGLKSVRMISRERAHLISITNKTPDIRVTLKNRITCHPTIS
jgi:hypothetical protein